MEIASDSNKRSLRDVIGFGSFRNNLQIIKGKCFLSYLGRVESDHGRFGDRVRRLPNMPNISHNPSIPSLSVNSVRKESFYVALRD
jgi:hypothetical protein